MSMNPFKTVWCINSDADEYDERPIVRWRLWWMQWFGNDFSRCWKESRRTTKLPNGTRETPHG